jgi:hypothetical protein
MHKMLLLIHRILPQNTGCVRTDSRTHSIVCRIKVSLRGNRRNAVPDLETLDCRSKSNDLRGGVRTWDAMILDGDWIRAVQHGDLTVVEGDGIDLDDYIVVTEV